MREIEVVACDLTIKYDKTTEKVILIKYLGDTDEQTHTLPEAINIVRKKISSGYSKGVKISINRCQIEYLRIPEKR